MKKFLLEILIFSFILILTIKGIKSTVPFYWGNKLMEQKIEYLESSDSKYDTYFIGSSKTFRHIDPILFEKITGTPAFNLGCSGMFALETEYMLDNFLSKESFKNTKDIYVQNTDYMIIGEQNRHTLRVNYYMDTKRLVRGVNYFIGQREYSQAYYHLVAFIENQLCIGQISEIIDYKQKDKRNLMKMVADQNGFYSLEQDLKIGKSKQLENRHNRYLKSVENNTYTKRKAKDIRLVELNKGELGIDTKGTKIWQIQNNPIADPKYYFDRGHYNLEGAKKYTKQLAHLVKKLNESKKQ